MFNWMRTKPRISSGADLTPNACHLGITSLIGDDVYDGDGKCLGEVEEIIVDAHTGCIRYAVLAFGGLLGFGRQRFAVPWFVLTVDRKYQRCVVDVALMRLIGRPVPRDDPWLQPTGPHLPRQRNPLADATPKHGDVWSGG
ncbi:MAG: PRC-barrel domain-containing protein [Pseudomonadota bacterium]|nr:PRC-barrel domain-containing protein [Pseudomonadota bacterium]